MTTAETIYDFPLKTFNGKDFDSEKLKGKVVLIVNTASKCGFAPQLTGLEKLHKDLKDQGLVILGFPSAQFGGQEPLEGDDLHTVCQRNFGVSFQLMQKADVNGDNAMPIYEYMKKEKPGFLGLKRIKWNFEKFLVDRNGKVVRRYASIVSPESIESDIKKLL